MSADHLLVWLLTRSVRSASPAKIPQATSNVQRGFAKEIAGNQLVKMEEKVRTFQVLLWIGQVLTSLITLPSRGLQAYMKLRHASPQTLSTKSKRGCEDEDESDLCEDANRARRNAQRICLPRRRKARRGGKSTRRRAGGALIASGSILRRSILESTPTWHLWTCLTSGCARLMHLRGWRRRTARET